MATQAKALVVDAGGERAWSTDIGHFCRDLCNLLAVTPSIELASPTPITLDAAIAILRDGPQPAVPVLVGDDRAVPNAIARLPRRDDVMPIPVVLNTGGASLTVPNAGPEDIVRLVCAAVEAIGALQQEPEKEKLSGEVISLGDRRATEWGRSQSEDGSGADAPESQLPVPNEAGINVHVGSTLVQARDWAYEATAALIRLWSIRGDGTPIYGLSWDDLLASVERLRGIADAPVEKAHEQYRAVRAMLGHDTAEHTPLIKLYHLLNRDDLALMLAMIVLAPELDIRLQRLFGALQDDPGRRHVSMGLACAILAVATEKATPRRIRSDISELAQLRAFRIVEGIGDTMPAADEPLRIDPRLLDWLLTGKTGWLAAHPECDAILRPPPLEALKLLPASRKKEIEVALRRHGDSSRFDAIILAGSERGWIEVEASVPPGDELRIAPPAHDLSAQGLDRVLREVLRKARLLDRRLVVDMLDPGPQGEAFWHAFAALLPLCGQAPLVISDNPAWLLSLTASERIAVVTLPPVAQAHREKAIVAIICPDALGEVDLAADLAERFRLPLAVLPDVLPLARAAAGGAEPGPEEWKAAFRNVAGSRIPHLARRIPPRIGEPRSALDRVVLPKAKRNQLEAIIRHVKVGGTVLRDWGYADLVESQGVVALFSGDSGTGKTMAAHAIASELGTDLYVIDLARVVSKYIGETEKNIASALDAAEEAGAMVLFDEADALFGKRGTVTDAVGHYANMQVGDLLQRIVRYRGLAILTTNLPQNIDRAFDRRMRFRVEFPLPSAPERLRICDQALPIGPRRHPSVDFRGFAQRLELTGGGITEGVILPALIEAADDRAANAMVWPRHLREATGSHLTRRGMFSDLRLVDSLFPDPCEEAA